jgi:DNA adenine methylase
MASFSITLNVRGSTPRRKHRVESFLRWAGSKRSLVGELSSFWPQNPGRYIEPFAGSACLFFYLEPDAAILSDLNSELMNTYAQLRRDCDLVLQSFRRLPKGERAYYRIRNQNPQELSPVAAAARFLYLNRYCFNGLFRTNKRGVFNVPYGPPRVPLRGFEERVRKAAALLLRAEFCQGDFEETLSNVRERDFVYLDPPYVVDERRVFTEYLADSFGRRDIKRLERSLQQIDAKGAFFVLSYDDSADIAPIGKQWRTVCVSTRRNIAGFAGARKVASEILMTNIRVQPC